MSFWRTLLEILNQLLYGFFLALGFPFHLIEVLVNRILFFGPGAGGGWAWEDYLPVMSIPYPSRHIVLRSALSCEITTRSISVIHK
jgi:hypothetical protein